MKDLDFDELDRAVSSLLGDTPADSQPGVAAAPAEPAISPVADASATARKKTLAEKRSSGRFMDVVHPSSDMKNAAKPPISRLGVTLTPPRAASAESVLEPETPSATTVDAMSITPPAPVIEPSRDTTMPDPLDFHGFAAETVEASLAIVESENAPELSDSDASTHLQSSVEEPDREESAPVTEGDETTAITPEQEVAPLESPFVSNAQPEKRPLGAFSDEGVGDASLDTSAAASLDTALASLAADSSLQHESTDEEAHDELTSEEAAPEAVSEEVETQDEPVQEVTPEASQPSVEAEMPTGGADETTPSTSPSSQNAPVSIPQQYATAASSEPPAQTPVFDTETYHQALQYTPKKRSGWLTVLLLLGLLLLGVGAGAALYFFGPFDLA